MISAKFIEATRYATLMHGTQKRKAANRTHVPYMVHPLEVVQILIECGISTEEVLIAAVLHDVLEDCRKNGACEEDLKNKFGNIVLRLVQENTDDPSLDKMMQKTMQVLNAAHKSEEAAMIKCADKTSNMRDIVRVPPGWPPETIVAYVNHAREVVNNLVIGHLVFGPLLKNLFWNASQEALDVAAEMKIAAEKKES